MPDGSPPDDIRRIADERAAARRERDFATADRLKAQLEDAGWKVVDRGTFYDLEPAHPPDVETAGRIRYGRSASVPSVLHEPAARPASVVIAGAHPAGDVARAVNGLRTHAREDTQIIVAADDPSPELDDELDGVEGIDEVVRTSAPLGFAAVLNAAIRRASGAVVVVLDQSIEPTGDIVSPLVAALGDPSVAVAGASGLRSADLRNFREAPVGDVDAVEGYAIAFRRDDYRDRGPLDERFRFYRNLDIWWSLVLRDESEGESPRRAVTVALPLQRHEHRGWTDTPEEERTRLSRRNFYRIIDRFGWRRDLLVEPAEPEPRKARR
jgi:hypothetical protein